MRSHIWVECPDCGRVFSLITTLSRDEWLKKYAPTKKPNEYAQVQCHACWRESRTKK